MPRHTLLMQAIQSNVDQLYAALSPEDATSFDKRYEELFQLVQNHPEKSEEIADQLISLVNGYPSASQVLSQTTPSLFPSSAAVPGNSLHQLQATRVEHIERDGEMVVRTLPEVDDRKHIHTAAVSEHQEETASSTPAEAISNQQPSGLSDTILPPRHSNTLRENRSPAKQKQWTPEQIIQFFKEIITAMMGLVLVGYTIYLTNAVLGFAGDARKLPDAKDLLLLLLSLTGVVLGYYFGRIPADARAAQAQNQADEAKSNSKRIGAEAEEVNNALNDFLLYTDIGRVTRDGVGDPVTNEKVQNLRDKCRELSDLSRLV